MGRLGRPDNERAVRIAAAPLPWPVTEHSRAACTRNGHENPEAVTWAVQRRLSRRASVLLRRCHRRGPSPGDGPQGLQPTSDGRCTPRSQRQDAHATLTANHSPSRSWCPRATNTDAVVAARRIVVEAVAWARPRVRSLLVPSRRRVVSFRLRRQIPTVPRAECHRLIPRYAGHRPVLVGRRCSCGHTFHQVLQDYCSSHRWHWHHTFSPVRHS